MDSIDHEWLKNRIGAAVDDDWYLDRGEEKRIKEESAARGIPTRDCELVLREELDGRGAVSERMLVEELDRLLHQFTDRDKKLDRKEERDALNKVIEKRPNKKAGLDPRVAEEYVASFCKANGASRSTDTKPWVYGLAAGVVVIGVIAVAALIRKPEPVVVASSALSAAALKVAHSSEVLLNDTDRAEIDDQLRRATMYIESAQYTDPPEKSAKASLDQIKQIDPQGQYRGKEVKGLASKIVEHYLALAEKSAGTRDLAGAERWLARARLLGVDRELIIEKERMLGIVKAER